MDEEIDFTLEAIARINPSEDREKVLQAIKKIMGDALITCEESAERIIVRTSDKRSIEHIREMLRDRRIRAAARKIAEETKKDETFTFLANKQAATVGILSLCSSWEESPLGPIELVFRSRSIDSLIDFLTSYEEGGKE